MVQGQLPVGDKLEDVSMEESDDEEVDGDNGEEIEGSWLTNTVSFSLLVHEKKMPTMVESRCGLMMAGTSP